MKNFIVHYVNAEAGLYQFSSQRRAKEVFAAVFEDENTRQLVLASGDTSVYSDESKLIHRMKNDIERAGKDPLFGQFSEDRCVSSLGIRHATSRAQQVFPTLMAFINTFSDERVPGKAVHGGKIMVAAILANMYRPRMCNGLQAILGHHLGSSVLC